jgi:DNA-binding ferritin-like protein
MTDADLQTTINEQFINNFQAIHEAFDAIRENFETVRVALDSLHERITTLEDKGEK